MPYVKNEISNLFCPAIHKSIPYEFSIYHSGKNVYANCVKSQHCVFDDCPFQKCKTVYKDGKLILRD